MCVVQGGKDLFARVPRVSAQGRCSERSCHRGRDSQSMVERVLNDSAQLIACGLLGTKGVESTGVGVESSAAGPQGEEQHPGISLLNQVELAEERGVICEHPSVGNSSLGVIDM